MEDGREGVDGGGGRRATWGGGLGQQGQSREWQGRKLRTDLLLVSPEINSGLKNFILAGPGLPGHAGNPSGTSSRETQGRKIRGCRWREMQ